MNTTLPILTITVGDVAGTGPELVTKALVQPDVRAAGRLLVVGDGATLARAMTYTGATTKIRSVAAPEEATFDPDGIDVLDLHNIDLGRLKLGRVDPMAGKAAYEYVKVAAELALAGRIGAIVTCALNKEAMNGAGFHYDGHAPDATLMLVAGKLRVSHVSTHVSLREAIERVRPERILKVLRLTHDAVRDLGVPRPRVAVAGLNPHAGEHGLFGDEEGKYIEPAITAAGAAGIDARGPFPGDTVFFRTMQGDFDAAVAMYHDQGHVATKMLGIWLGVNVTLGLPIIRTSVEHGTNFGKAGTGRSDPRSLIEAIKLAAIMAGNRLRTSGSVINPVRAP
jgi:4-hydroxythreonine-4-phosphate dehydrogenase